MEIGSRDGKGWNKVPWKSDGPVRFSPLFLSFYPLYFVLCTMYSVIPMAAFYSGFFLSFIQSVWKIPSRSTR